MISGERKGAFKKINRGRVSDDVLHQIKKSIVEGVYKPGEKLPSEKELLETFDVSRGSLRVALKSLERLGFIGIKTGVFGGAYVADSVIHSFSTALYDIICMKQIEFREVLEMREVIEPAIAALAAERRDEEDMRELETSIAVRDKAVRMGKIPIVVNIDFHQAVAKASKNEMFSLIIDVTGMILNHEFKKLSLSLKDHASIIAFHKEIAGRIREQDGENASRLMRAHVVDVTRRLLDQ